MRYVLPIAFSLALVVPLSATAADDDVAALAAKLQKLDLRAMQNDYPATIARHDVEKLLDEANAASSAEWKAIKSRAEWETFRAEKLGRLKASLKLPKERLIGKPHLAGELSGEGYQIQKLIYETRPGWFVTANLYLPAQPLDKAPGILLSHSHHSPKTQGELQDMGATWARAGCAVLVPDHLGHGERRQHPFASAMDYEKEFPVGRQDYNFRYDESIQLYLAGESLMGWMVHDMMGGVDVLLALPGIDKTKIALFGGVAGGGDPAAVTGAVDERIAIVGPFNFGGPQPETRYPLPDDAETWFGYAGGGSWESTRNLADSAKDGFLPWVIVGSVAPRKLVYGHEFSWDRERDPVYKRFEKIWGFYDAKGAIGVAHGAGTLKGQPPESTHCGNIGAYHRKMIHPLMEKWFGVRVAAKDEFSANRKAQELWCWTPEFKEKLKPKMLHEILAQQAEAAKPDERRAADAWMKALAIGPEVKRAAPERVESESLGWTNGEVLSASPLKLLLLKPEKQVAKKSPLVVAVAQGGAKAFLAKRSDEVANLLAGGAAVCFVDVRHTGASGHGNDRGQHSEATSHSATYLMAGKTLLGEQVQDLRRALVYLRTREDIDAKHIALWGESFAEPLAADAKFHYPRRVDRPGESDPLGAQLVLLTALVDKDTELEAVFARGGLASYASVLESPFVQMPHSALARGVFYAGDMPIVAKTVQGRMAMRLEEFVDGRGARRPDLEVKWKNVDGAKAEITRPADWLLESLSAKK